MQCKLIPLINIWQLSDIYDSQNTLIGVLIYPQQFMKEVLFFTVQLENCLGDYNNWIYSGSVEPGFKLCTQTSEPAVCLFLVS